MGVSIRAVTVADFYHRCGNAPTPGGYAVFIYACKAGCLISGKCLSPVFKRERELIHRAVVH